MARPTKCYIDLSALKDNFTAVKKQVGKSLVLCLVKADAYGHGLVPAAQTLEKAGADYFGVASLEEGALLRQNGIHKPVLCLGPLPFGSEDLCVDYALDQAVCTVEALRRLEKAAEEKQTEAGVHIKIETGMHRTGVRPGEALAEVLTALRACPHLRLDGVFTHFSSSDSFDDTATKRQTAEFLTAIRQIREAGFSGFLTHCANSGAILSYPELYFDMVRAGVILYGYYPSKETKRPFAVKPVLSFKTAIVALEDVKKGESVSYSGTFTAEKDLKAAVLPVGYGDGYKRALSNRAFVLIGGKKAPILGNICMDMTMVDVTDIPEAALGSEAVLIGSQQEETIGADELAEYAQTISYEIMLSLTARVPKIYLTQEEST